MLGIHVFPKVSSGDREPMPFNQRKSQKRWNPIVCGSNGNGGTSLDALSSMPSASGRQEKDSQTKACTCPHGWG